MPFESGKSGNPGGRARKEGEWAEALRRAANEIDKTTRLKKLHLAARSLVKKAIEGDVAALREFGDRYDGKVGQPVTHDVAGTLEELILASMAPDEPRE
jgi:hypothetical protein